MNKKPTNFLIFFKFFNKYSILGIIIILCSIIIELELKNTIYVEISVKLLSTIGIALMIGAIFDFSKNSQAFTNFVSSILKDIIINRSFFNDLDETSKKQSLEMILRPSEYQIEQYADLNDYFQKKINDSMGMFHTNFKTNLVLTADAKKVNGRVVVYTKLTYRIYKVENEYKPIITTFERDDSHIGSTKILYPGGYEEVTEDDVRDAGMTIDERPVYYQFMIPERLYQYPYLTIRKDVIETGYDHWTNVNWISLTPSDGINYTLTCYDGINIKEYILFDDIDLYNVEINDDLNKISIVSSSWLDKSTGFTITISDTKNQ